MKTQPIYTTPQGFTAKFSRNICTLFIPKTKGIFSADVQAAKRDICTNHDLPYFKEIKIIKQ